MFQEKKFAFKIISVLKLSWKAAAEQYASARSFHALSLRLDGKADFSHEKKVWHTEKNSLIYVPKDYDYRIKAYKDETVLVVHFDILDESFSEIETFTPINAEIFQDLFEKLYSAWTKKPIGYEYRLDSLFSRVLENIAVQTFRQTHDLKQDFLRLIDFIHSNFTDPTLTVDRLAAQLNVSGTYLRRLFLKNLQISPLKYLTKMRIDYATSLLQSGYYSVNETAELSGFSDPKYFSTLYKKETGSSPGRVKPR